MSSNSTLSRGVRLALTTAATAAAAHTPAAVAQEAPAAGAKDTALQEVVVTGSRIRRVDVETASPVLVIDAAAIQQSGITTTGELLARIPSVSGAATTPAVNNGGGFGESSVELRGLDAKRTLVLVDGRRIGLVGTTSDATDVNQIPVALIERVEVLKEGAGAIYGSDAVGGVVNFITRKNVDGIEISGDYGRTSRKDGQHYSAEMLFGTSTDKASIIVGGNFTRQEQVSAGNRDYSKFALYFYGGTTGITKGGSSRVPTGRIYANPLGLLGANGKPCTSLTRIAGAAGTALTDYRCFGGGASDLFNYQPLNLIMTPQERASVFAKVNYQINDYAEAYVTAIATRAHSGYQAAPLPFDSIVDDVVISKNNIYNPFAIDFGGISGLNPDFTLRSPLGNRRSDTVNDSKYVNMGVRGKLGATGWNWDASVSYSHFNQLGTYSGYYLGSAFKSAVGPSFLDTLNNNQPTCGTPTAPISGCTPLNIFNPTAPDQIAALNAVNASYNVNNTFRYKEASLDFNGKIVDLPAGALQASIGADYSALEGRYDPDSIVIATPPLYLQCQLSNETCTGPTSGKYNSRQVYLELFAPLLKDLPGVHSLNVDFGTRHSDYSLFGNTTKSDFKVEYRPVVDLLIRGTFSQVFRVPTISDLYSAPANTSVTFNDPCTNITAADITANPNLAVACQGVPLTGTFQQPNGQITGLNKSNPNLKPESGRVTTYGFVYEPRQVPNLSFDVDVWKYKINNVITLLDSNYSIDQCVKTGSPQFCNLVNRYTSGPNAGLILVFVNPTINLGTLETNGVDFGVKYALKNTRIGSFRWSVDVTQTRNYDISIPGADTTHVAGTFNKQYGNYAKYRAFAQMGWTLRNVDALMSVRYIHHLEVGNPTRSGRDPNGIKYAPGTEPSLAIPSVVYFDFTLGYTFPTKTKVQAGIRNIGDKQPPNFFQNNVTNANTDVNTYDTLGRQWFMGFNQKF